MIRTGDPHPKGGIYVVGRSKQSYMDAIRSLMLKRHRQKLKEVLHFRHCKEVWGIIEYQGRRYSVGYIKRGNRLVGWPGWPNFDTVTTESR